MIWSTASPRAEVNRYAADLLRRGQALRHPVDNVRRARAAELSAVCRHEADRTGAEDSDRLTGLEAGQADAVPARGEDIGEQDEVVLVLLAGRQFERVEVCVRDPDVLGLATAVG